MSDIVIRKAKVRDQAEVRKLFRDFTLFHDSLDPWFGVSADADKEIEKHIRKFVYAPARLLLVAEKAGVIVGFLTMGYTHLPIIYIKQEVGYFSELYVRPGLRKRGIADSLVAAGFEWLKEKKIRRVELETMAANRAACEFWRKQGFDISFYGMRKII